MLATGPRKKEEMKESMRTLVACLCGLGFVASPLFGEDLPLSNWTAPASWSQASDTGHAKSGTRETLAVPARPIPFNALAPCRLADTRNGSFPIGYGPPLLSAGAPRDFLRETQLVVLTVIAFQVGLDSHRHDVVALHHRFVGMALHADFRVEFPVLK